jgi:hypothetical protein
MLAGKVGFIEVHGAFPSPVAVPANGKKSSKQTQAAAITPETASHWLFEILAFCFNSCQPK